MPSGKGVAKGKGKGKVAKAKRGMMPRGLIGMDARTDDDEPICFDYNLAGCTRARPGETCHKAKHVCCKKGCHWAHSQKKRR